MVRKRSGSVLQHSVKAEDLLAIQQDIEVNAVALARIAVFIISTGYQHGQSQHTSPG